MSVCSHRLELLHFLLLVLKVFVFFVVYWEFFLSVEISRFQNTKTKNTEGWNARQRQQSALKDTFGLVSRMRKQKGWQFNGIVWFNSENFQHSNTGSALLRSSDTKIWRTSCSQFSLSVTCHIVSGPTCQPPPGICREVTYGCVGLQWHRFGFEPLRRIPQNITRRRLRMERKSSGWRWNVVIGAFLENRSSKISLKAKSRNDSRK